MATTVGKLADELGIGKTIIKNFLRATFGTQERDFKGSDAALTSVHERAVRDAAERGELKRDRMKTEDVAVAEREDDPEASALDLAGLEIAPISAEMLTPSGREAHAVFVHDELVAWFVDPKTPEDQLRRFARHVHELMAHGRTTRMKGVTGKNRGWLRTPLGGNSGSHFYLWVLNHGDKLGIEDTSALYASAPKGARYLRVVRHHDDTADPLRPGAAGDYQALTAKEALPVPAGLLRDPLVAAQRGAVQDSARVRVIISLVHTSAPTSSAARRIASGSSAPG